MKVWYETTPQLVPYTHMNNSCSRKPAWTLGHTRMYGNKIWKKWSEKTIKNKSNKWTEFKTTEQNRNKWKGKKKAFSLPAWKFKVLSRFPLLKHCSYCLVFMSFCPPTIWGERFELGPIFGRPTARGAVTRWHGALSDPARRAACRQPAASCQKVAYLEGGGTGRGEGVAVVTHMATPWSTWRTFRLRSRVWRAVTRIPGGGRKNYQRNLGVFFHMF